MSNEILFSEKQRFNQWWFWLIIAVINGIILFGIFWQIGLGHTFGDKPMSNAGLVAVWGFVLLLTFFMRSSRLETQIKKDGIYIKFFPFHFSFRQYKWDNIAKAYVRKYSPLKEYGGWGVRYSRSGKAFNVSGNKGLQLEFTNGRKLLIGTNKPEELTKVLEGLGKSEA